MTTRTSPAPRRPRRTAEGVVRSEIDGVPAYWPVQAAPGPLTALLVFRVGHVDETLPTRGITHLAEHLALTRTEWGAHAFNGATGSTTTTFSVSGDPEQVRTYLADVSRALGDLPIDRFEHERQVVRTEEAGRGFSAGVLWRLRWGPQGPGLLGYDEFGTLTLDGAQVADWARTRFVRQRAALVFSGPPPRRLALHLADGEPAAPPTLPPAVDELPAWFAGTPAGFGLSWVSERSTATRAATWVLATRLTERLRQRDGLVYGVGSDSDPLTPDSRHELVWTSALAENSAAAGQALVEVLGDLRRDGRWTEQEQQRWRAFSQEPEDPRAAAGYAFYLAYAHLIGETPQTRRATRAASLALTADAVGEAMSGALSTLLLAAPPGTTVPEDLARPVADWSATTVAGRRLAPAHGQKNRLVLGQDGISDVSDSGRAVSVLFSECRAVLAWDDGARTLIGADGFAVAYRPEQWREGVDVVHRTLDAALPPGVHVPVGAREPLVVARSWHAVGTQVLRAWRAVGLAICTLMLVLCLSTAASLAVDDSPFATTDQVLFTLVAAAVVGAWPVRTAVGAVRRRRGAGSG